MRSSASTSRASSWCGCAAARARRLALAALLFWWVASAGGCSKWFCRAVTAASVRHARPALRSPGTTRAPGVGPAGPLHRRPRHMSARRGNARPAERTCGGRAQCGQAAARQMVEQNRAAPGRGGAIINMSSVNAVMAIPSIAGYNASKGGVNNLTRCGPCPLRPPRPALRRVLFGKEVLLWASAAAAGAAAGTWRCRWRRTTSASTPSGRAPS